MFTDTEIRVLCTVPDHLQDPSDVDYQFVWYTPEHRDSYDSYVSADIQPFVFQADSTKRLEEQVEFLKEALKKPVIKLVNTVVEVQSNNPLKTMK